MPCSSSLSRPFTADSLLHRVQVTGHCLGAWLLVCMIQIKAVALLLLHFSGTFAWLNPSSEATEHFEVSIQDPHSTPAFGSMFYCDIMVWGALGGMSLGWALECNSLMGMTGRLHGEAQPPKYSPAVTLHPSQGGSRGGWACTEAATSHVSPCARTALSNTYRDPVIVLLATVFAVKNVM